jgi:hypothetical protein
VYSLQRVSDKRGFNVVNLHISGINAHLDRIYVSGIMCSTFSTFLTLVTCIDAYIISKCFNVYTWHVKYCHYTHLIYTNFKISYTLMMDMLYMLEVPCFLIQEDMYIWYPCVLHTWCVKGKNIMKVTIAKWPWEGTQLRYSWFCISV